MSSSTGKMFVLRSGDGVEFEVEEAVVTQSGTLKLEIEKREANDTILVPKVKGEILSKVIEYCKKHAGAGNRSTDEEIKAWDAEFVKVDISTLYDLMMATFWLDMKDLMEFICNAMDDVMEGLSDEQLHAVIKIQNDCLRQIAGDADGIRIRIEDPDRQ